MLSLITNPISVTYLRNPSPHLKFCPFPPSVFELNNRGRAQKYRASAVFQCFVRRKGGNFGFLDLERGEVKGNSMCCRCMSEGDKELEEKILEYMDKSDKPERFPTEKELIDAGRFDLVKSIKRRGGWFSLGWAVEDKAREVVKVEESEIEAMEFDIEEFKRKVESGGESDLPRHYEVRVSFFGEGLAQPASALPSPSSSGRSLDLITEEDSGIEGILSRLEKQRNSSLGIDLEKTGHKPLASNVNDGDPKQLRTSTDVDRMDPGKNGSLMSGGTENGTSYNSGTQLRHYTTPDTWRSWSTRRAGLQNTEFEAGEIFYRSERAALSSDIIANSEAAESQQQWKGISQDHIRTRLQHLESELSSALLSLKSYKRIPRSNEDHLSSSCELHKLSDAWEFQDNEIISTKEKLRSIRAKLAVLEGKMALTIIEAQKRAEEKQRRIEGARKALQLLRTIRMVWPNSASEVLLVGSYDGWTTQRKMKRSKSGIFWASLKLYPGRYEIKFIVDGVWRTDPLRPIVHNNGYENNLLLVS